MLSAACIAYSETAVEGGPMISMSSRWELPWLLNGEFPVCAGWFRSSSSKNSARAWDSGVESIKLSWENGLEEEVTAEEEEEDETAKEEKGGTLAGTAKIPLLFFECGRANDGCRGA